MPYHRQRVKDWFPDRIWQLIIEKDKAVQILNGRILKRER